MTDAAQVLPVQANGRGHRYTQRKQLFVAKYLELGDGAKAAREAGYAAESAKGVAWRLLRKDPDVIRAVEEGRQALQLRNQVNVDTMIVQFDEDRQFAVRTENATACVRASELKAKLAGLLIDRRDVRSVAGVRIEVVHYGDEAA